MSFYLPQETILNLVQGLVDAGMCTDEVRDSLLAHIDKGYRASLPSKGNTLEQVWSDLSVMNGVPFLSNGQVPLRIWLTAAVQRLKVSGLPQRALFQKVLNGVVTDSEHRIEEGTTAGQIDPSLPVAIGASREDYRTILENFLVPFEGILRFTRVIFDKLRDDRLAYLEYHPGRLQDFFASLPEGDQRKDLWMKYIELLQKKNRRAVELIEQFYGRIVLDEFRAACDEYLLHAEGWELAWQELKGRTVASATSEVLRASPFPGGLEDALTAEFAEVRHRAGL
jgi:hypothetical protein